MRCGTSCSGCASSAPGSYPTSSSSRPSSLAWRTENENLRAELEASKVAQKERGEETQDRDRGTITSRSGGHGAISGLGLGRARRSHTRPEALKLCDRST